MKGSCFSWGEGNSLSTKSKIHLCEGSSSSSFHKIYRSVLPKDKSTRLQCKTADNQDAKLLLFHDKDKTAGFPALF